MSVCFRWSALTQHRIGICDASFAVVSIQLEYISKLNKCALDIARFEQFDSTLEMLFCALFGAFAGSNKCSEAKRRGSLDQFGSHHFQNLHKRLK